MSLKQKHIAACEQKDFYQKQVDKIAQKIREDKTGAFWYKEEYIAYMYQQAVEQDNQEKKGALYGLTFGAKDVFTVKSLSTTAGSKILSGFKGPYTSTLVKAIEDKGALLSGKLAMDEFAMGSYSNTSHLGRVTLVGKPQRTAGGSSGGSASALDVLDFTLGSDTGGSVRQPASFGGYVGYKPSYGTFSRFGMISYASSLDQAGLLTHSVEDLHYLMSQGIAASDSQDMTSVEYFKPQCLSQNSEIKKIGYFPEILNSDLDSCVKEAYQKMLSCFPSYMLHPIIPKYMKYATQVYYIIACAQAAFNLARYQGIYFGSDIEKVQDKMTYWQQVAYHRGQMFGPEVQKRIMLGSYITSSEHFTTVYKKATDLRSAMQKEFKDIFSLVDTLVLPVSPFTAPTWESIGQMSSSKIYMADYMTVPFSLAGLPAISMPLYKDKQGLAIGMQFVGAQYDDAQLISKCLDLEKKL